MPGLDRSAPREAVAAMQGINRSAVTPVFMTAFLGTALLCLGLAVWGVLSWHEVRAKLVVVASALYLVGAFGVTVAGNVPRNEALERVDAAGAAAASGWNDFFAPWLALNHVRTVTALAALGVFVLALGHD